MACMRFSAWSKTIEDSPSNTSSVTSMHVMPNFCAISDRGSRVVECRQAVHELHVRIASLEQALVRNTKGLKERMRSAHLSLDSPIDSHTSV